MRFDVLTLFPEMFNNFLSTSIIGRAIESNKIEVNLFNIRDFATNKHKKVDDVPFGGGAGMVMMCQPLFDSIEYVKNLKKDKAPVIFLTPKGETLDQIMTEGLAQTYRNKRIILLCGHYEGIDERVRENLVDREISIGNFVLTGGELPAQILIDAMSRLIPGVLGEQKSSEEESFSAPLNRELEYPHYTRPAVFRDKPVPEVLLSGHHAEIDAWRKSQTKPVRKKI